MSAEREDKKLAAMVRSDPGLHERWRLVDDTGRTLALGYGEKNKALMLKEKGSAVAEVLTGQASRRPEELAADYEQVEKEREEWRGSFEGMVAVEKELKARHQALLDALEKEVKICREVVAEIEAGLKERRRYSRIERRDGEALAAGERARIDRLSTLLASPDTLEEER